MFGWIEEGIECNRAIATYRVPIKTSVRVTGRKAASNFAGMDLMTEPRNFRLSMLGLLIVLAFGPAGCSRGQNDFQLKTAVQNKISNDPRLRMPLQVRADDGIVILSGTVTSAGERIAAEQDAAQVDGVKVVADNLKLIDLIPPGTAFVVRKPKPSVAMAGRIPPLKRRPKLDQPAISTKDVNRPPLQVVGSVFNTEPPVSISGEVIASNSRASTTKPSAAPSSKSADSTEPASIPVPPERVTVPKGTLLNIRLTESVSSEVNQPGDTFLASLASPVMVNDSVVIPAEAGIQGKIVDIRSAGHFSGRPELVIGLTGLAYNGKTYELHTNQYSKQGPSRNIRTAAVIGAGAGIGAIIGGILGGGKGAGIGAIIGGGTGTGAQAASKTPKLQLPSESVLSFKLQNAITVIPSSTLERLPNASASSMTNDPFSDWRPVLKRRPGNGQVDEAPSGTGSEPETAPPAKKD